MHPRRGGARDGARRRDVVVVVGASIVMERSASELGAHHGVAPIVVGALVLAACDEPAQRRRRRSTSRRGRGAAVLSTSLNSNAINVLAGLLIPTTIIGIGAPSGQTTFVAAAYPAMTALALVPAPGVCHGLRRGCRRG